MKSEKGPIIPFFNYETVWFKFSAVLFENSNILWEWFFLRGACAFWRGCQREFSQIRTRQQLNLSKPLQKNSRAEKEKTSWTKVKTSLAKNPSNNPRWERTLQEWIFTIVRKSSYQLISLLTSSIEQDQLFTFFYFHQSIFFLLTGCFERFLKFFFQGKTNINL